MLLNLDIKDLGKYLMVGDKVLIKPKSPTEKTKAGLLLPPGVEEKRKIHSGYVIKVGPGFPIPYGSEEDESWKASKEDVKYLPLQAREGDLAVYYQDNAFEIEIKGERFVIISHSSILMLVRDEEIFD
ncbi:MAG: co-chaperone GroES [Bacteroidales bacterium]|nr:co-chaperone GroES [Bacteroidales bacterium]